MQERLDKLLHWCQEFCTKWEIDEAYIAEVTAGFEDPAFSVSLSLGLSGRRGGGADRLRIAPRPL